MNWYEHPSTVYAKQMSDEQATSGWLAGQAGKINTCCPAEQSPASDDN
jgi:hypothetical protein